MVYIYSCRCSFCSMFGRLSELSYSLTDVTLFLALFEIYSNSIMLMPLTIIQTLFDLQ